jgi:beta-galactosidase GanA
MVHNQPFLIRGGELGNSSASSLAYLNQIWPTLEQMNLNTLLVPVYWELLEPIDGTFDFSLVDSLIIQSRKRDMKLILLWFGSWKNSMSCYVPGWVKTDPQRFPRALNKNGQAVEILSPFCTNNLEADKKAFTRLMQHLKKIDSKENTVIMVQVENEIGMLPDARDYSAEANKQYKQQVPSNLLNYLKKNQKQLLPEFRQHWEASGKKMQGTWAEVFGDSTAGEEVFMAWHFAQFTEELTKAGKSVYPLPMFINAALNRVGYAPGEYPSAGPLPHLLDVWWAGAPSIDILTPDIYFPNFEHWCRLYQRGGNPLFIPEARFEPSVGAKMFYAMGNHDAMGFSPFSIESTDNPGKESIVKSYDLIKQLSPLIISHQGTGQMAGFRLTKEHTADTLVLGGFQLTIKHDYTLGWSPDASNTTWPDTGGIIICTAPGEYWVAGSGLVITFGLPENKPGSAGIYRIDEGTFTSDFVWQPKRLLNGDQSHQGRHLRIPVHEYGIQKLILYTY